MIQDMWAPDSGSRLDSLMEAARRCGPHARPDCMPNMMEVWRSQGTLDAVLAGFGVLVIVSVFFCWGLPVLRAMGERGGDVGE